MKNIYSERIIFAFVLLMVIVLPFFQSCSENEKIGYGAEYTPDQKQQISDLARQYGIQFKFTESPQGELETVEELEHFFKSLTSIYSVMKIPFDSNMAKTTSRSSRFLKLSRGMQYPESGIGSDSKPYTLEPGEIIDFNLNLYWRADSLYSDARPIPTVNINIGIDSYKSAKGRKYSIGNVSVSQPTTLSGSTINSSCQAELIGVLNGGIVEFHFIFVHATIDMKSGIVTFTLSSSPFQ